MQPASLPRHRGRPRDPRLALAAHARADGPLRRVLAAVAARFVARRGWERLGFARLGDYAVERLGTSARTLQDLAHVGAVLEQHRVLAAALVSRALCWSQVRLLARVVCAESEQAWVAFARQRSVAELAREVRALDRGSVEQGALARPPPEFDDQREAVSIRCTPDVRGKWSLTRALARRVAGESLPTWECMEAVAAEVLSALPVGAELRWEPEPLTWDDSGVPPTTRRSHASAPVPGALGCAPRTPGGAHPQAQATAARSTHGAAEVCVSQGIASEGNPRLLHPASPQCPTQSAPGQSTEPIAARLPRFLVPLVDGLDDADAFELDARLKRAVALEQAFQATLAELLLEISERRLHRDTGHRRFDDFVREQAGLAPRTARMLLRLARAGRALPALGEAWRGATLSTSQAHALVPVLDRSPGSAPEWIAWARSVSVRRLQEDVDHALRVAAEDPVGFERSSGLPAEARSDSAPAETPEDEPRGLRVQETGTQDLLRPERSDDPDPGGRQTRAPARALRPGADPCHRLFWLAPPAAARFFRAVLCSARRHLERTTGRLPTEGEAFAAMLEHALVSWCPPGRRPRAAHRVFERDGWRCTVPGCSSYRNLQDHHVIFRSAGGSDETANRVTLCAWHHLRGVHAGRLRVTGRAPQRLRYDFGLRPGSRPWLSYVSGDRRLPAEPAPS